MDEKTTEAPTRSEIALQLHPDDPNRNSGKKRSSARPIGILLLIAILAGGFFLWRTTHKPQTTAAAGRGRGDRNGDLNARVPVSVTAAQRRDLPVYLDGLGSVQAFNTVTVKSRVDGQMMQVLFKEGQEVNKGDLLAIIDPRPYEVALAQAQANFAKDQAQLTDAKLFAQRDSQLLKDGIIPQQQYDTQVALTNQLQAATAADQAQMDNAKLNIDYAHITSPIDGRVGLRLVDSGNIVHASDQNGLLVITQMQPIAVIFALPEDNLQAVNGRTRSGATLQVKALSRDDGTEIASGTLLTIDNKKNGTIIPVAAVQRGDQGNFVYRVKPSDNTAEVVPVTLGVTEGTLTSIENGISPNDLVVTDGQDRLRAGVRVEPRPDTRSNATTNPANPHTDNPAPQSFPASPRPQFQPPAASQSRAAPTAQDNQPNTQSDNPKGYGPG